MWCLKFAMGLDRHKISVWTALVNYEMIPVDLR